MKRRWFPGKKFCRLIEKRKTKKKLPPNSNCLLWFEGWSVCSLMGRRFGGVEARPWHSFWGVVLVKPHKKWKSHTPFLKLKTRPVPSGSSMGKWYGIRPAGCLNTDFIETYTGSGTIAIYCHKLFCQICFHTVGSWHGRKWPFLGDRQLHLLPINPGKKEEKEEDGFSVSNCAKGREASWPSKPASFKPRERGTAATAFVLCWPWRKNKWMERRKEMQG